MTPEIDIILPTYNRRAFLPKALQCVCAQTFRDWRLIVINDGGDDVADLVAACDDARIVYYNRLHLGKAAQLNFALGESQAKYIAYMDDDDEIFPGHLQKLHALAEERQADFVYSDTWMTRVLDDGRVVAREVENSADVTWETIRIHNRINHKQILHARELSDRVGGYDETLKILIDFDYIKRLMKAAKNPVHLREVTGEHFLREATEAISDLWHRNPEEAGRSVMSFFAKDPEALAMLYHRDDPRRYHEEVVRHIPTALLARQLLGRLHRKLVKR